MPDRARSIETELLIGAIAGVVATTAMTLSMAAMFRRLAHPERYPLPPRELTEQAAAAAGARHAMDEPQMQAATLASHFGFGALMGSLYATVFRRRHAPDVGSGIGFGLLVWTASYLGWVPGLALLRPATEHPARRNGLMIAAHAVWGAVLGSIARHLSGALAPFAAGPLRDR
jgi:uncharacterized membrane protein YagU involved in acid resistance